MCNSYIILFHNYYTIGSSGAEGTRASPVLHACARTSAMNSYTRLAEEPPLRPPSKEYIESYCRAQALARASSPGVTAAARPLQATAADRRGPRLFNAGPGDAVDYASFCTALSNHRELRGLRDADEIRQRAVRLRILALAVSALALTQTVCAGIIAYTFWVDLASGANDVASLITTSVVIGSGCFGLYGGIARSQWALQAFFLSQVWALAVVLAQWLRSQQQSRSTSLFCDEHRTAEVAEACSNLGGMQIAAILLTILMVYLSMFVTDSFAQELQTELEREDQLSLIRFSWLMHRKTLVGVQRFEDMIHTRFEELVNMGFLRPRQKQ